MIFSHCGDVSPYVFVSRVAEDVDPYNVISNTNGFGDNITTGERNPYTRRGRRPRRPEKTSIIGKFNVNGIRNYYTIEGAINTNRPYKKFLFCKHRVSVVHEI